MSRMHKIGQGTLDVLEALRRVLAPISNRVLDTLAGPRVDPSTAAQAGMRTFEQEAEAIMSTARTHRAQTLVRSAVIVTVVLIVWASVAKVDEVTKGEAKVIPSRQLQVIQSLDGGVVSEILVKEGQVVEAGQMLLKIDETRATSGVRESAAQAFSLRVKAARLKALAEDTAFEPPAAQKGNLE
ncbi:MAG: biotin/lipoyl-binding protein, partial [Aquabacterium sp.]